MISRRTSIIFSAAYLALALTACSDGVTSRALEEIRGEDMGFSLEFLGSPEFRGRSTPSAELDIASKYIALTAERIGLKPLMPDGSFYQEVPVEVTTVVPSASRLRLTAASGERVFGFPDDATVGRGFETGQISGGGGFVGVGLGGPRVLCGLEGVAP